MGVMRDGPLFSGDGAGGEGRGELGYFIGMIVFLTFKLCVIFFAGQ